MSNAQRAPRRLKSLWLSAWPLWTLAASAVLGVLRVLPEGYARAAVGVPVLLAAPGALTLGAIFGERNRPRGVVFASCAALLGMLWTAFASLLLYACSVPITAGSVYLSLLAISAVMAVTAEGRILLGAQGRGRRVAGRSEILNPDLSASEAREARVRESGRRAGYQALLAVAAGATVLAGGLYAYDHLPHPAADGYTWMAWTGPRIHGDIAIGTRGSELHFEIAHRQSGKARFRLAAMWLATPMVPVAKPVTLTIGPHSTFGGTLFVPPLPDGCTYRIVVDLTALRQVNPLTKKTQSWSINVDVRDPRKSSRACKP